MNSINLSRIHQAGAALIVALILLVGLTLITVTGFNLGVSDLRIVGNMQHRSEALNVAQQAIEQAISSTRFIEEPDAVYASPCSGQNTFCSDVNGDGVNDILVTLDPPTCVIARPITLQELHLSDPEDLGCAVGVDQNNLGVAGAAVSTSLCGQTTWEIRAVAVDTQTQTQVAIREGVALRVPSANLQTNCP
jgi:Tfp pilus assembly protein PilX